MSLYKYTPALTDPDVLKKTIVGRDEQLKTIERILKSASSGRSFSHALLIGPRGIGKTHILRVIYHAVRGDIEMGTLGSYKDRFVPVITPEEEYVDTIEKFLSLIVDYIVSGAAAPLAAAPADRSRDALLSYVRGFKGKTGRVLLLLIDNFNDLLDAFTEEDQSALRELLMTSRSVLLIGAAPTLFEAIVNHDKPLYNFFETIWLTDLSFDDMKQMLRSFADIEERKDLIEQFESSDAKLRAIHALSGGNPRLILSLYQIMAEGDVTSVEATFLKLVDGLSPLFREKMKDISRQQREIIDIMARSDGLLTPTEIASATKLPVNVVNAQIKRLETFGYLQKVPTSHAKRALYQIRERLFALWRQMRVEAGRKRLGFIVKFYEAWYTREELQYLTENLLSHLRKGAPLNPRESQSLVDRLWYVTEACGLSKLTARARSEAAYRVGDYRSAEESLKSYLSGHPDDYSVWHNLGSTYYAQGNLVGAATAYRKALEIKPDDAEAWLFLGGTYANQSQHFEAIEAFRKALEIKPDDALAWYVLGATYTKQQRWADAIEALRKGLAINPDQAEVWACLAADYGAQGNYAEESAAYRKALEIKPDYAELWYSLCTSHLYSFGSKLDSGSLEAALPEFQGALSCLKHLDDPSPVVKVLGRIFRLFVERQKIDILRAAHREIETAGPHELRQFLSPYGALLRYLETRDHEIIDRLRPEERTIIEEMLKVAEAKPHHDTKTRQAPKSRKRR